MDYASYLPWKHQEVSGDVPLTVFSTAKDSASPPPLICVHGISASSHHFASVARHYKGKGGLLALDLRGRGRSGKPKAGSYGMKQHAADVIRVMDHFHIARAVLAGHSMGAFVVEQVALDYPERVTSLVLLDGGWARATTETELSEDVQAGLKRAFGRLAMTFETPLHYMQYWFPHITHEEEIDRDYAEMLRYDLEETSEGTFRPRPHGEACMEDAQWLGTCGPCAQGLALVKCPVWIVHASSGFIDGSVPLLEESALETLKASLDVRGILQLPSSNHYTMLFDPHVEPLVRLLEEVVSLEGKGV